MERFIILDSNRKVISIRNGTKIVEGEIESDVGEIGQIQQADGTFITPTSTTPTTKPITLEEIQANQIVTMGAINDLYAMISNLTPTGSST